MSPQDAAAPAAVGDPQALLGPVGDPQAGPYDVVQDGRCALGHPVNGFGRCDPLNTGVEVAGL